MGSKEEKYQAKVHYTMKTEGEDCLELWDSKGTEYSGACNIAAED